MSARGLTSFSRSACSFTLHVADDVEDERSRLQRRQRVLGEANEQFKKLGGEAAAADSSSEEELED